MAPDEPVTRGGPVLPSREDPLFAGPVDDPDRYELVGDGITGGEGTTWRARYAGHLTSPLPLAVKLLHRPRDADPTWPSTEDRRRWQDQTALLRYMRLDHVVHVHEVFFGTPPHGHGTGSGAPSSAYVAMEWVDGPTLQQEAGGSPATAQDLRRRLGYISDAASALASLASTSRSAGNPSLHRDIKPTNCIIAGDRGIVLIDVSTLRLLDDGFDPDGMHTPGYTAPEVLAAPNFPRSPASDMYSLGALALFCLTGRDPATTQDAGDVVQTRRELSSVLREAGVPDPDALAAHVLTALDFDPARRPRNQTAWSGEALTLSEARPVADATRERRLWWIAGAVAVAATAGILIAQPWRDAPTLPADHVAIGVTRSTAAAGSSSAPTAASSSSSTGKITSPVDRSDVKQCAYLIGTSRLQAGWTLILSMRNTSNNDPHLYAEFVLGWRQPETLATWQGAQFFGQVDDAAGQHYQVQLIAVPLDAARRNVNPPDYGDSLARSGKVLDSIRVTRIPGTGPHNCDGPP